MLARQLQDISDTLKLLEREVDAAQKVNLINKAISASISLKTEGVTLGTYLYQSILLIHSSLGLAGRLIVSGNYIQAQTQISIASMSIIQLRGGLERISFEDTLNLDEDYVSQVREASRQSKGR